MHQDVEAIPMRAQLREAARDFLVAGHVHHEGDIRLELLGERDDPVGHALDVREGQRGALAMHGLRDSPGDGTVGGKADDQRAFAAQKSHALFPYPCCRPDSTYMTSRWPALI